MTATILDRLAAIPLFESVPRQDLEWVLAHGDVRSFDVGTSPWKAGEVIEEMWIMLEGRAGLYVEKSGAIRRITEAAAGQIVGTLPFSRFRTSPGHVVVDEPITVVAVHQRHFPELIHDHLELTAALVHHMVDRSRAFRAVELNDDRLQSLSRLASGFAHELNNPASAAARTAQSLAGLINEEEQAARQLAAARLSDEQLAAVDAIRSECGRVGRTRSALEAADREDEIADWLGRHRIDARAAPALAMSDLSMAALDHLAGTLPADAVAVAIRWVASGCAARIASNQIEAATARIHDLVGAVKGFTFMDREGVPEQVDIARGLADTVAMMESKARTKFAALHVETAANLPRVEGFGSELNQVWQKLVDNALDAVDERGSVTVTAAARPDSVLVRVADDGPGIPENIRARVFDPFFTTKPVGKGTGLGLDIARRIIQLHRGDIDFTSQPGRTVFRVRLPAAGAKLAPGPGL
ncbi:MAG TPA: ATP-binding protein [Vicinamibacterales bacterium]|nr:ATP-binding protein [Vicinamibacterales bacterium]